MVNKKYKEGLMKQEIIKMYLEDFLGTKEIANKIGTNKSLIYRILKKEGVAMGASRRKKLLFQKKKLIPYNKRFFTDKQTNDMVKLYKNDYLNPPEICKKFNVSPQLIVKILKEKGVHQKSGERKKLLHKIGKLKTNKGITKENYPKLASKFKKEFSDKQTEKIINLYNIKFLSSMEIGKFFNCSGRTILRILKEKRINTTLSNRRKNLFKNGKLTFYKRTNLHKENMSNMLSGRIVSGRTGKLISNKLKGRTWEEVYGDEKAKLMKEELSRVTIIRNLEDNPAKRPDVKKKIALANSGSYESKHGKEKAEEIKKKISKPLEKNPNWRGGISFEPYTPEFNKQFKLAIKQRDGFMCLKCGIREEDAKTLFKRGLTTHHIDYIKENTFKENCCALCLRCNSEVNKNRESWTKFFQSLLNKRYNYQYSESGEVVIEFLKEKI